MDRNDAEGGSTPQLTVEGAIATIRLCRPAKANRIETADVAMLREHCAFLRAGFPRLRALIVTAEGRQFSAGFDIGSLASGAAPSDPASGGSAAGAFADMVAEVEALPQVSVCALNGGVFGGATDLALACDFRIGVAGTRLRLPAVRLGLHYPSSGMARYVARLGLRHARRIFLLGEELDARQLLDIGYLDAVLPAAELVPHALALARSVAANAPLACAGMKATLNALGNAMANGGACDANAIAQAEQACLRSADLREGIAAWREKRPARFEGH